MGRREESGAGFLNTENDSNPSSEWPAVLSAGQNQKCVCKVTGSRKSIIWMRIFPDCFRKKSFLSLCPVYGLGQLSGLGAFSWSWQGWVPRGHPSLSQQGLYVGEYLSRHSLRTPQVPHLVFVFFGFGFCLFFATCKTCGIVVPWPGIEPGALDAESAREFPCRSFWKLVSGFPEVLSPLLCWIEEDERMESPPEKRSLWFYELENYLGNINHHTPDANPGKETTLMSKSQSVYWFNKLECSLFKGIVIKTCSKEYLMTFTWENMRVWGKKKQNTKCVQLWYNMCLKAERKYIKMSAVITSGAMNY